MVKRLEQAFLYGTNGLKLNVKFPRKRHYPQLKNSVLCQHKYSQDS